MRIGIIGLTTSHVVAFTKMINDPAATGVMAEMQVVAGFTGGMEDNPSSWGRRRNSPRLDGPRRRDLWHDRRVTEECRRRASGERGWPATPGASQTGNRRWQAAVY